MSATATTHGLLTTRMASRVLVDAGIAAAVLAGSLVLISHGTIPGSDADTDLDALGVLLAACSAGPLVAWRWSPLGAFAVSAAATAMIAGLGYPLGIPLGAGAALYLLAGSRDEADPWTSRTTAAVVGLFGAYLAAAGAGQGSFPASELLHGGLAFALAWFAGERTRLRRARIAELEERARRAEREAERERRLAVAEERVRIARDLHDAAGHAINVITVRAGAARLQRDPERSQAALELIEEIARQTATEIDGIVGTLRDPDAADGAATTPLGLASLDTLIARHAAAGLEVSVSRQGMPQPLDRAADQAAYRILQEALTNAARHGVGEAWVELAFGDAALDMTVTNRASGGSAARSNGGHGVIGMRERATVLGGSVEAGQADGTFRVRARLPYRGQKA